MTHLVVVYQRKIDKIESEIDKKTRELAEIIEFAAIPEETLEAEIEELLERQEIEQKNYDQTISKIKRRHDVSVKNTNVRMDRIINAAEKVACEVIL